MNEAFTAFLVQISIKYTGVIKAKCHYYVFQHTRGLRHFYSPVFIMRLLSAVLVLLNIAYMRYIMTPAPIRPARRTRASAGPGVSRLWAIEGGGRLCAKAMDVWG